MSKLESLRQQLVESQEIARLAENTMKDGNATWADFETARDKVHKLERQYLKELKTQEKKGRQPNENSV